MKKYKFNINNSRAYILLRVFKTMKQMNRAIEKDGSSHSDNCLGMFSPATYYINSEGVKFYQDCIGTMYLNKNSLTGSIVSHECLHAAMTCERTLNRFSMQYGEEIDDNEERLCYLLSDIVKNVYNILYDKGYIK